MKFDIPFIGQVEDDEQNSWIAAINSRATCFRLVRLSSMKPETLKETEVAIVANPDPATLNNLPNLKWVQSLWAGVEGMLASNINPDISIVRLTDPQMAESMSEAVLAWSLYLHRKMPQYAALQSQKQWRQLSLCTPQECKISIFGLGKLGSRAALRMQQNNFTVRGWSRSEKSIEGLETFHGADGFDSIVALTDIAVILLPLTADTKRLFNKNTFAKMPQGASIINFARAPVLVESDLLDGLDNQHMKHAVLDVFDEEPLPAPSPLWSHPDVTVLPHISAPTTVSTASLIASKNIDNYFTTGDLPVAVDRVRGY